MSGNQTDKQIRYLEILPRRMRAASISIVGCFLISICILVTVELSSRVYGREEHQNTTTFDLIGVLLASSAFITTVGAGLSAWLVIDAAAEYKQLTTDDEQRN
jgi:pheromone shutdown protein TraB